MSKRRKSNSGDPRRFAAPVLDNLELAEGAAQVKELVEATVHCAAHLIDSMEEIEGLLPEEQVKNLQGLIGGAYGLLQVMEAQSLELVRLANGTRHR